MEHASAALAHRSHVTLAPSTMNGAGARLYERLLTAVGEDPNREALRRTPERAWEALLTLTEGYATDPADVIGDAVFDEAYDDMIVLRDIEFYSLCEHHLLPFFGTVTVGYIPDGRIVGLSKVPRLVDAFARRLQVQERLTVQIAEALQEVLQPRGVGVSIEASHLCMMMRGVEKQRSTTATQRMSGVFATDPAVRSEFMARSGRRAEV